MRKTINWIKWSSFVLILLFKVGQTKAQTMAELIELLLNRPVKIEIVGRDTLLQKDLTDYLNLTLGPIQDSGILNDYTCQNHVNHDVVRQYFLRPHPSVSTVRKYFEQASEEFNVPVHLLHAIGYVESNWTQVGPSIDYGWGIMHLVSNHYCNTLGEAAILLGVNEQTLKDDARSNIRASAKWMRQRADYYKIKTLEIEEWRPVIADFSGLISGELRQMQAENYLGVLKSGASSITVWNEAITINPTRK